MCVYIQWCIKQCCLLRCAVEWIIRMNTHSWSFFLYTGYTQKKGAVSKVNKKFISHLTRAQRTPSAAATVQVSYALPAVRFLCLLQGQFPRWRCSRRRLSVCSILRCPDLWLQCSVFRAWFRKYAPHRNNITRWYWQFVETGCLCKGKSPGRPRVSDDNIERVREVFQRSSRKSLARASRELDMSKITLWKVLPKRLCFKPYKMRLVQALTPADKVKRHNFCEEMQLKMRKMIS